MGTFNSFAARNIAGVGGVPVWLGVVSPMPVGGVLASGFCKAGIFIPAGTPINISAGVIKPFVAWEVVSASSVDKTITVKAGTIDFLPNANDVLGALSTSNFAAVAKASKLSSVAADSTEGQYVFTFADTNLPGGVSAGQYVVYSTASAAAASGAVNLAPNAYLYNDICIDAANGRGTVSEIKASGAAVNFHGEGLLINRTSAGAFKSILAAKIPNVMLVEY